MKIDKDKYWIDIDSNLEKLLEDGFVKLPSLSSFAIDSLASSIKTEMGDSTFKELSNSHDVFLKELGIQDYLIPKLYDIAKNLFSYKGKITNQYHVSRKVEPGNSKEMYRAHFDSHIFTMVLPIQIPNKTDSGSAGDLIYFPNARPRPRNDISNTIGKIYHKKFASKKGLEIFSKNHQKRVDNFYDYRPLLFIGNTTLHTNKPVTSDCDSYRLTCLAHFFDPSPRYGVGSLIRSIRNR